MGRYHDTPCINSRALWLEVASHSAPIVPDSDLTPLHSATPLQRLCHQQNNFCLETARMLGNATLDGGVSSGF
jgi:hypothetical protein